MPVALGGLGNNRGAVIGGLILGLFQQAANFLVGGIFASVAVFTLFIVVLLAAPQGLAVDFALQRVELVAEGLRLALHLLHLQHQTTRAQLVSKAQQTLKLLGCRDALTIRTLAGRLAGRLLLLAKTTNRP